jgi:spermidine synthase
MRVLSQRLRLAVLCSGASALMYEVLWTRALTRQFGSTMPAVTTVVATFMAGMTLGALRFGTLADRSPRPFELYRRVELGIAASALGLSWLLLRAPAWLEFSARVAEAAGTFAGLVRSALFGLLLLGPSTLIGATLIVLARAVVAHGSSGRALGSLYAMNLAGAVLGTLLPDFLLIPKLGLMATAVVASAGNLLAALLVSGCDRAVSAEVGDPARATDVTARRSEVAPQIVLGSALYAVSGCCAMAAEVLWSRTLEHWAAAMVTSFAVLLAVYLAFVALGSWLSRRLADRVDQPLSWATLMLCLWGPAVLLPIALAPGWRDLQRAWLPRPSNVTRPSMWYEALNALMHAVYLQGAACLLMGAAFPFLAAASVRAGRSGQQTARLYAANTLAGVFGSIVAGFVWLPALGELYAFCAAASLAAIGSATLAGLQRDSRVRTVALAALACTLAGVWFLPPELLQRAHFRGAGHIVAMREGTTTTAAVAQRFRFGAPQYSELLTPGVSMSDTSFGARRYMGLMAHLAAFFSQRPERALLICYGAGNTADSLLSHPDLQRLDIVDISREVLALSPELSRTRGRDPLRDPRSRVFVDDGRHHLIARAYTYDLITSEPPPPNHAGVVNLYSQEYYRAAKLRLRASGVLTQWLPVFQLSARDSLAIIAAFTSEFPHAALFYGFDQHWVLVGSQQPLTIDHQRWRARAALPRVAADLQRLGAESVYVLYGAVLLGDAELRALVRGVPVLRDDAPSIEYPQNDVRSPWRPARAVGTAPRALALLTQPPVGQELEQLQRAASAMDRVFELLERQRLEPEELWEVDYAAAVARFVESGIGLEATLALIDADRETAALAERMLAHYPDARGALAGSRTVSPREHEALLDAVTSSARRGLYTGHPERTLSALLLLPEAARTPRHAWLEANAALELGQRDAARRALERALAGTHSAAFASRVRALMTARAQPAAQLAR